MNDKQQEQHFLLSVMMIGILIITFAMLVDCGISAYAAENNAEQIEDIPATMLTRGYCTKIPVGNTLNTQWSCSYFTPEFIKVQHNQWILRRV